MENGNGVVRRRESLPSGGSSSVGKNIGGRRNSIAAKMAAEEALMAEHRAAQKEKDREFAEFLKTLELESARDTHSVAQTKLSLVQVLISLEHILTRCTFFPLFLSN